MPPHRTSRSPQRLPCTLAAKLYFFGHSYGHDGFQKMLAFEAWREGFAVKEGLLLCAGGETGKACSKPACSAEGRLVKKRQSGKRLIPGLPAQILYAAVNVSFLSHVVTMVASVHSWSFAGLKSCTQALGQGCVVLWLHSRGGLNRFVDACCLAEPEVFFGRRRPGLCSAEYRTSLPPIKPHEPNRPGLLSVPIFSPLS